MNVNQRPSCTLLLLLLGLAPPHGQLSSPRPSFHLQVDPSSQEHSPLRLSVHYKCIYVHLKSYANYIQSILYIRFTCIDISEL